MTPELWPLWWLPQSGSLSITVIRLSGNCWASACAVARPTMPPPMIVTSLVPAMPDLPVINRPGGQHRWAFLLGGGPGGVLEEVFVELVLLSSSATHGTGFLEHALPAVADWLDGRDRLLFIPCAKRDGDAYLQVVRSAVAPLGVAVDGLHQEPDPVAALRRAAALFVGGGNTFRLLSALQRTGLVEVIRERVQEGMPYLGASAGTNVAGPSLRTSNDMPIVPPASFEALGLVPFQINPHYVDPDPRSTH